MDLQKQLSKLEQDSFNGQISISDFRKRVQTYAETYHALQLQQTGVMPCFSYGQIITDGTYDAKVIENTTIVHSTMVKYLHNDIFDNISGIGWKLK